MTRDYGRSLNYELRRRRGQTTTIVARPVVGGGGGSVAPGGGTTTIVTGATNRVFNNNSALTIQPGQIYGRDSAGKIQLADASQLYRSLYVAAGPVDSEGYFPITATGEADLTLDNPGATVAVGDPAWLSATVPGAITPTRPATGYAVGFFATTTVKAEGTVSVDLRISGQGMN